MRIVIWGGRGSIPVSGPEYLTYGGDTTCLEIRTGDGEVIIVDAGTGIRRAGNRLLREGARHIHLFFTHAHWDHILGFPFFPHLYEKGTRIEIYGCSAAQASVREMLSRAMSAPSFPVNLDDVEAELVFHEDCRDELPIGRAEVRFIALSHPNGGSGYSFAERGRRLVFLTDNELGTVHPGGLEPGAYAQFAAGADLLLHDAEFTDREYPRRRRWGHSTWQQAVRLALDAGVGRLGLWHHNMERTDEALERIVAGSRGMAAKAGSRLDVFAVRQQQRLSL
jgi:phosphoribosyl 1,2-cyclic phosphodiesterase